MTLDTVASPPVWAGFTALVLALLALDLGVFHRRPHEVSAREAAAWSAVWVALAALFGVGVHLAFGPDRALEFAAGYLIEKALAVDNIFVFVVIFAAFGIPARLQHRVLFWGVLGALVLRAGFVLAGGALLQAFHGAIYVFGALLAVTGVRLLFQRADASLHPEESGAVRLLRRFLPVSPALDGARFLTRVDGRLHATPLLLALAVVEVTDVVFAVDSIPAIFAVTSDPFIVFTSNILAILGLRSLYFLLAGVVGKFAYLKMGLALVLVFVGAKMLLSGVVKIPVAASLGGIAAILGGAIAASLWRSARTARQARVAAAAGAPST